MQNFISINIIYIRNKSGLSQEDIGNIIGTSYHAVSSYEKKKSLPPIDKIQIFCKEFNLNIDDFVNKDLSKIDRSKPKVEQVDEATMVYEVALKDIKFYQSIIAAKEGQIEALQDRIIDLNKHNDMLYALLNQNGKG